MDALPSAAGRAVTALVIFRRRLPGFLLGLALMVFVVDLSGRHFAILHRVSWQAVLISYLSLNAGSTC